MIFHQVYLEALGHASYLVGSEQTGEALVLDVRRDVDAYYELARGHGLRIRYAADTHQHNDYVSGITELAQRSPLELLAGARAGLGYKARALADGERLRMGEVEFEALHTPGHTPEHVSFLVRDHARGDEPAILLSGGALLVDDVARPDLLGSKDDVREAARALRRSLQEKVLALPDHVLVYPTHVKGSLCAGHIGSMLVTTIGYERRMNRLLRCIVEEAEFEKECLRLDALPTVPPYWRRMRGQNQAGPAPLGVLAEPAPLRPAAFSERAKQGAVVLDCRMPDAFGAGHVPGALNVGLNSSFPTWAGTVLPPGAAVLLVLERPGQLWEVAWHLLRIGYAMPEGWLAGGMLAWRSAGLEVDAVPQWTATEFAERAQADRSLVVLDVRQPAEWQAGHLPRARHIPGGELPARVDELPRERPIAVYCGSGYRSSVATSVLKRAGRAQVANLLGGFAAWKKSGLPVEGATAS